MSLATDGLKSALRSSGGNRRHRSDSCGIIPRHIQSCSAVREYCRASHNTADDQRPWERTPGLFFSLAMLLVPALVAAAVLNDRIAGDFAPLSGYVVQPAGSD